jgi:hypothetical protein
MKVMNKKIKIVSNGHANTTRFFDANGAEIKDIFVVSCKIEIFPNQMNRAVLEIVNFEIEVVADTDARAVGDAQKGKVKTS